MATYRRANRYNWLFPNRKMPNTKMDNEQASFWLSQFIGKNLRVHASDGRVFGGQMKCTDKVSALLVLSFAVKVELVLTSRRTATSSWHWRTSTVHHQRKASGKRLKSRETRL
jgi:hypothetical protein